MAKEEVEEIFKQHGEVAKVNVVKTRSGAAAFVLFQKFTPAMQCLNAMGKPFIENTFLKQRKKVSNFFVVEQMVLISEVKDVPLNFQKIKIYKEE